MPILRINTLVGYASGLILLDKPWGIPKFTTWFSFSTLFSLGMLITVLFLITDMAINYSDFVEQTETSRLGMYIAKIESHSRLIFYFITRFVFIVNAKKLSNIFSRLYYYPMKDGCLLKRSLKKFDCLIIGLSYICVIVIASNSTQVLVKLVEQQENYMLHIFGASGYGALVAILGIVPIGLSDTIPFVMVISVVRAILRVFKEFCNDMEGFLRMRSVEVEISGKQPLATVYPGNLLLETEFRKFVQVRKPRPVTATPSPKEKKDNISCRPQNRQDLVSKFYDMVDLFDSAGKLMSPFVFVLMVTTTVELVGTVSTVVVIGRQGVFLVNDIVVLVKVAVHLCLLQVGHQIQVTFEKGKSQVRRAFMESSLKTSMKDVVSAVLSWEWTLSGMGFFEVDRSLAAGTISLLLTYVVIIFQLQLTLTPTTADVLN